MGNVGPGLHGVQALHRRRCDGRPLPGKIQRRDGRLQAGRPDGQAHDAGAAVVGRRHSKPCSSRSTRPSTTARACCMGGKRVDAAGPGEFMQPTILTDIAPGNPAYHQEFFGPVAMFFRVADEDAAVALANDSPFGLGGSVFTQDAERGRRVARRIETGMVFVNSAAVSTARPAVRRRQELGLRPRTGGGRHPRVRQPQADPRRLRPAPRRRRFNRRLLPKAAAAPAARRPDAG